MEALAKQIKEAPMEQEIFLSTSEFAKKHCKSEEILKKHLRHKRIAGAQMIKSENSKRGVWAIPYNAL